MLYSPHLFSITSLQPLKIQQNYAIFTTNVFVKATAIYCTCLNYMYCIILCIFFRNQTISLLKESSEWIQEEHLPYLTV